MPHRFLPWSPVVLLPAVLAPSGVVVRAAGEERPPITGRAVPHLKHFDQLMLEILRDHKFRGASLAVARDGRLVFARGYGWADFEDKKPVRPDTRFNLASCSKPITASAVLKLVDEGKLRLDDKAFAILDDIRPPEGAKLDPRVRDITVRHLLHHAGGLPRPVGPAGAVARRLKVQPPVSVAQATSFHLARPLLFDPGSDQKYSNLGFVVLRLIVERVSGQEYEKYTAERVLGPMGIPEAHLDLMEGYRPREACRYGPDGKRHRGGHGEISGCGGCWVLSPTDALRFMTSLDGTRGERVLSPRAFQQMLAPLPSLGKKANERHNGLGWDVVERTPAGMHYAKNGGVAGISTWMEHLPGGVSWALFFNGNLKDEGTDDDEARPKKAAGKSPWPLVREAIQKVNSWPEIDLFTSE